MSSEARDRAVRHCVNATKSIMEHKLAQPFCTPVDWHGLGIPQYPEVIKYPMDYGTINSRLLQNMYETMEEWTVDMQLVLTNAKIFNPPDHVVHEWASQLQGIFDKKLAQLNAKQEMQIFKRPPRVRKGAPMPDDDWQRCRGVLRQVQQSGSAYPFLQAVDWKTLGIPDYPKIIKNPMDIGTIEKYLMSYMYATPEEFAQDMKLVFKNAKRYNLEGSDIHRMASDLETHFDRVWADMVKNRGTKRPLDEVTADPNPGGSAMHLDEPASRAAPVKLDTQVTDEERRNLGNRMNRLTGEQLGQLIDLVRDECPKCYEQFSEDECEIDIDALDRNNFDRLLTFVNEC